MGATAIIGLDIKCYENLCEIARQERAIIQGDITSNMRRDAELNELLSSKANELREKGKVPEADKITQSEIFTDTNPSALKIKVLVIF